jgi:hypothetical protein
MRQWRDVRRIDGEIDPTSRAVWYRLVTPRV